ncbi:MAG: cupin domain-containing protein [Actinomycetota bacterium]
MKTEELTLQRKRFDHPDDSHAREGQLLETLELGGIALTKITMQPGWRWSKDAKHREKTDWCEHTHIGYQLSGRQHILMADGSELETEPGDFFLVPPGHDGWVVGDEPSVFLAIGNPSHEMG